MDAPSSPWIQDRPESQAVRKLSGAPGQYQAQGHVGWRAGAAGPPPSETQVYHAHPSEFRELVQRLTGRKSVPSEAQTQDLRVDDLQGQSAAAMSTPEGIISENDRFEQAGLAAVAGYYRRSILSHSPLSLPPAAASWQFSPPTPKSAEQLRDDVQSQIKQTPQTKKRIQKLHTEAPVCALVDAMFRLPSKLDRLLVSYGHMLPRGAEVEIPLIKQDLEKMVAILLEHDDSGAEDPSMMVKCLTKEVRELSYDMEDSVDQYLHAVDSRRGILSPRRKEYKITPRRSKATSGLREKLKWRLWMANKIREFSVRSQEALQRYSLFNHLGDNGISAAPIGGTGSSTSATRDEYFGSWYPSPYGELVGIDGHVNKLQEWLGKDGEQKLKVVSIVGSGGIGKTTLAKELYRRISRLFDCRAFVRTSRKPDVRRLLISMLSQIRPHHTPHNWKVHSLIADIRTHLQDKRYLIVIDDVWATQTWDIINRALPAGNLCSGILVTTEVDDVALKCCDYDSKYVLTMKPLGQDDSSKLFFSTVFGPQYDCPPELSELANNIIRKCAGLPLAIVTVASLLANQMGKPEKWDYVNKSLGYGVSTNPSSEGMKQVLNLSYNNLVQHLKACVMYLSIYEGDYVVQKDDLVKQWIAGSFIRATNEKDMEEISRNCFDELINSRMIQPVHINDNGDVLSCTVHHMVLDFITHKSIEENFVTTIDHCQTTARLADMVRRLSLHFGNTEAIPPINMRISQVRTLAFFGVIKSLPSIVEFGLVQVLILHLWRDDESVNFDLAGITGLFRLRYLHVTFNATIEVPQTQMRGLKYLETLKIDARLSAVPSGIVHLPSLLHLSLPVETNLPNGIGRMTSLCTLGYFDLCVNTIDNVQSLGKLTNLRDLRLTCSTVPSSYLNTKMDNMGSILAKLSNLRSVTLEPSSILDSGPSSMSISCDGLSSVSSPPVLLQRFEWLPCICTFSSIPKWIGYLNKLCILKIGVRELASNDVDVLRGLPALTVLSLYVRAKPAERIVFAKTGFSVLKCFKFRCSVPWLEFQVDAMPNLLKLKLGFDVHGVDQHGTIPVGIVHLTCLKEISAKIGGAGAANDPNRRAAESALIDAINMHPARPTFNIQCHNNSRIQEEEHMTLQKQYDVMEEDLVEQHGVLQKVTREDARSRLSAFSDWKTVAGKQADSRARPLCPTGLSKSWSWKTWLKTEVLKYKPNEALHGSLQEECGDNANMRARGRKTLPMRSTQVRVSSLQDIEGHDDGFSWRKYGQKDISGSKYPRVYYKCEHKHTRGCPARKRLQATDDDPLLFDAMYVGNHTCAHGASLHPQPGHEQSSISVGVKAEGSLKRLKIPSWKTLPMRSTQVRVSSLQDIEGHDDGFSWRKYGQKDISGSKYPRVYYKCEHKHTRGCPARKRLQATDDDPLLFDAMYVGNHICAHGASLHPQPGHEQSSISVGVKAEGSLKRLKIPSWRSKRSIQVRARSMQEDYPEDDGYSWSKYGQKDIVGAKHPRCYYWCVHRYDQGCQATKQVQRSDSDTQLFDAVYHGEHTCAENVHSRCESAHSLLHHISVSMGLKPPATSESQVTNEAVSSGSTAGVRFMSPATSAGSQVTYERGSRSTTTDRFMSLGTSETQVAYKEFTDAKFSSWPDDLDSTPNSPIDQRLDLNADFVDDTGYSDFD